MVEEYEELLSKGLMITGENISDNNADPQKRRAQLKTIIQSCLSQVDATKAEYRVADHGFVPADKHASWRVQLMKALVWEAVETSLEASLVWAGVCLILPILVLSTAAEQVSTNAFFYVTARIPYYIALRAAALPESQDPTTVLKNSMQIESLVVDLYQHALEFQFSIILYFYETLNKTFFYCREGMS